MDRDYKIGGHCFRVSGEKLLAALDCVSGFKPFTAGPDGTEADFVFCEDDKLQMPGFYRELYSFKYEDIDSTFSVAEKGYRLELSPKGECPLCLRMDQGGKEAYLYGNYSPPLVRFALWMGYGVMTIPEDTVAMHSSCIVYQGKAVLFLGESGTGKSTHTRLWREYIKGSKLLNDDSPLVRCTEGNIWVYGSPWSGKTPCYRTERYPLAGCVRLSQASGNKIGRLNTLQAFGALHPSAPPAFAYDDRLYEGVCSVLGKIISRVPVYRLACLPDRGAAELACETLFGRGNENDFE